MNPSLAARIATTIQAHPQQVAAAIALLDEGATVPFIARYRKEATGGLDDNQLRELENRLAHLRELEQRRNTILQSVEDQGLLDETLRQRILAAESRTELEDLYLPYRPRRRTRAQKAREAGLEPLLQRLLQTRPPDPLPMAAAYVNEQAGYPDATACLEGARYILMEQMAEQAGVLKQAREHLWQKGLVQASPTESGQSPDNAKAARFRDYLNFRQTIRHLPSHRVLALFRARAEGVLDFRLILSGEEDHQAMQAATLAQAPVPEPARQYPWVAETARRAWRYKILPHLTLELFSRLREQAEDEAIRVFGDNLRDLLLAPPAGPQVTLGIDPGLRTGIKLAVVNATGKLLDTATCYPHPPRKQWQESLDLLETLCQRHQVRLVAIGNGTASRETEKLVAELARSLTDTPIQYLLVSEAGASVYSASAQAAEEFPELDVSMRGAVSIARRLQDPLAELVKVPPQSIGVGQYQHDVNQVKLGQRLGQVVEDCVNHVGVRLNTASVPLLSRVAGLSRSLAENIVRHREQHGPFLNRQQLLEVPMLGPKRYQQCAGFLRIDDGDTPLDATAVHPEAYPLVERILQRLEKPLAQVMGQPALLRQLDPQAFTDAQFGLPTVRDVLAELEKPGRDPRGTFQSARFDEHTHTMDDLKPGQWLEGMVTNVTRFGAFVDIGVHQDGLVHISQLADRFVQDPRQVVRAGQIVRVRVLEVDQERRRIALSLRADPARTRENPAPRKRAGSQATLQKPASRQKAKRPGKHSRDTRGSLGTALAEAMKKARQ